MKFTQGRLVGWALLAVCIGCLMIAPSATAKILGTKGVAPDLPDDVPGIERPFPQDSGKFTFAIIGDKTGGGHRNWPIFDRALNEVNQLHPDFAIMVGDLIQGYTTDMSAVNKQWDEFLAHASQTDIPFFFLPGNHDISNKAMLDYWEANVGRTYYGFDYKDCHFLLLNTEEGWRTGEKQFGAMQLEFIRRDLASHTDAKHTFLFMHKPAWYTRDEEFDQWATIESYLGDRPYTVFAGHWHRLVYDTRRDHRYFVLSSTGAGLTEREVFELGSFHHYSSVTVDGDDVHIAFIQPGGVHPYDIAPREFREKSGQILSYERDFPLAPGRNDGQLVVHLHNTLEKDVQAQLQFDIPEGTTWRIAPNQISHELQPGEECELLFNVSYTPEDIASPPVYSYDLKYGGQQLSQGSSTLAPVDSRTLRTLSEWFVVGPFDLGGKGKPTTVGDLEASIPNFVERLAPEEDSSVTQEYVWLDGTLTWQERSVAENGALNLEAIYGGDYVVAYGMTAIHSPDDRIIYASVQGDDITKVLLNGEVVHPGHPIRGASRSPDYLALSLQEGWNTVLVKCADYTGGWGYIFRVTDPDQELRFARQPR